ncbi:hypothetical protein MCA1290 [Methylococcus capsulatus str. Bath]|uniref:Uncharacterized protein n=1 Tax=Methylococcus capsulatus (strain ATCC 33009 / NCIMB 11132 / Bath) TaxID=243233 RepID=Q609E5_METCA|nr:hypothetical protein [Methylococcus capsulatus]AAU92697.1 hypothetical protein MCA1290 [Methylococcus capsulatus str. Bath]
MIKQFFLSVLAILVLFEEWLWDLLTVFGQWISRLLHLERFDAWLSQAPPKSALVALVLPLALVTPLNVGAVVLMVHGAVTAGILLELAAKLLGTLLVARVFRLTRPALMSFAWFALLYEWIMRLLRWAHALVRESRLYRAVLAFKETVKHFFREFRGG